MSLTHMRFVSRVLVAVLPLVLMAGCPDAPGILNLSPSLAGTYWVEYQDGTLVTYELPADRGAEGTWLSAAMAMPEWYTGPALYEVSADGTWLRLEDGADLTLDEVMQLYDPRPAAPDASSGALTP